MSRFPAPEKPVEEGSLEIAEEKIDLVNCGRKQGSKVGEIKFHCNQLLSF
jgi:hypothetical protein